MIFSFKPGMWILAEIIPGWGWYTAYLVEILPDGYMVSFDADAPNRFRKNIRISFLHTRG